MSQITFTAYLKAAPQGSKRHVGKGILIESSKQVAPYRHALAQIALIECQRKGFEMIPKGEPVGLILDFYFLRPPSVSKKRIYHTVKPDGDKLDRSTLDALKGILYHDDSQVVERSSRKHYCTIERVEISCYTLSPSVPQFSKTEVSACPEGVT